MGQIYVCPLVLLYRHSVKRSCLCSFSSKFSWRFCFEQIQYFRFNPQIKFEWFSFGYICRFVPFTIAQWRNSRGWWYLRSLRMYRSFESGRGESSRLRQSAPVPLTEGHRTWYITAMGVSFFVTKKEWRQRQKLEWLNENFLSQSIGIGHAILFPKWEKKKWRGRKV